jgi:hypothetical protein
MNDTNRNPKTTAATLDTLADAAGVIRKLDIDRDTAEIGAIVATAAGFHDRTLCLWKLRTLARLSGVRARKLGACHEAWRVMKLVGPDLIERLNGVPISYDLYRQFYRLLKAGADIVRIRQAILGVASKVGRGLPAYMAGGLIDRMLAGCPRRPVADRSPWTYRPLDGVARKVQAAVAGPKAA